MRLQLVLISILGVFSILAADRPLAYPLGPGDKILIFVSDAEEYDGLTQRPLIIDQGGEINLPMIGRVRAEGRTIEQLETEISSRLKKFLHEPQVNVSIAEFQSRPVSVFGAVERPGVIQLEGPKTLWETISLAGGVRHEAGETIRITRRLAYGELPLTNARVDETGRYMIADVHVRSMQEMTNPEENIVIMPNDVISVSKANIVYVMGDVRQAGGYVNNGKLSVLQALSLAGGMDPNGNPKESRILRQQEGSDTRFEIALNLSKILKGQAEDIMMRPNDILYVPHSTWKEVSKQVVGSSIGMLTGIAIYRVGLKR